MEGSQRDFTSALKSDELSFFVAYAPSQENAFCEKLFSQDCHKSRAGLMGWPAVGEISRKRLPSLLKPFSRNLGSSGEKGGRG